MKNTVFDWDSSSEWVSFQEVEHIDFNGDVQYRIVTGKFSCYHVIVSSSIFTCSMEPINV